ncbi:MotA/TolQ/ExbB proton channel family protein [Aliivibrio fischeri]|uniref:MotA/TolQ/ExbB proton channel family protein n=1 Tax=Aliivibrio fischeri TaxID=668 RepID=UPI00084CC3B1|nr:MotA/TolQ/ExbB proton channel family protein [Aliivibrio fischeri]MUJ27995.1 hypothetical protein [Aliivibrio fischeri]OED52794.1 hypothetical protein BEI47_18895 [Aliivibrio fischeri]
MINSMMTFFKTGGVFMLPIAAVALLAFSIVIDRLIVLFIHNYRIKKTAKQFIKNIETADKETALTILNHDSSILSLTLNEAIKSYKNNSDISKDDFEELVNISAIHSVRLLTRRIVAISTFANVATLLGLLGTIMGLIQSFATVAENSQGNSSILSASVSVAMNTTAFGLMVAIPLLLIYLFIENTSNKALESLQINCSLITNKIFSL